MDKRGHGDRWGQGRSRESSSRTRTGCQDGCRRGGRGACAQSIHLGPPPQPGCYCVPTLGEGSELHVVSRRAETKTVCQGEKQAAWGGGVRHWPQISLSFPSAHEKATVPLIILLIFLCLCTGLTFCPNVRAARSHFAPPGQRRQR